ncbi:MAG: DUF1156 domain-containing protein, partial [Halobacteriaceae archaeon]
LAPNWWVEKENASEGTAVRPEMDDGEVTFELVNLPEDVTKEQYNPTKGSVSYGKATCLNCSVTIDDEEIREQAREGEMGYRLYCVEYRDLRSDSRGNYRIPREVDREAFNKAQEKVRNSPELASLLNEQIPDMHKKYDTTRWGITEWRDMFSPRQLLSHYEYWQAFEEVKPEIYDEYSDPEAEAILTFLSFVADKALDYNCRLCMWDSTVPKVAHLFSRHDFAFAWSFAEINLTSDDTGYEWMLGNVLKAYDDLVDMSSDSEAPVSIYQGDAADLPLESASLEAAVVDPPYYDNVMYSELSDFFYVWMKRYLGDVYPDFFKNQLTEKDEEAVAKEHKFEGVASDESTKGQLAKEDYERKMTEIFDEIHRVLDGEGIFTLMFTHKKTEAWDTLTKALINAGFSVKSTHPISTESRLSLHQAGKNSAESTILLSSEKRDTLDKQPTLWEDVK